MNRGETVADNNKSNPWLTIWRRFRRHKLAVVGLSIIVVLALCAIFAPLIAAYDPNKIDIGASGGIPQPPSAAHLFGTDNYGRDYFARALYGARVSMTVGLVSVGISLAVGIVVGALAGYYGGWVDTVLMRFVDLLLSIPTFFLILTVNAYLPPSIYNLMGAIGLLSWMGVARLVRGQFLAVKELDFVEAARALGAKNRRIMFRHLLPNSFGPVLVAATMGVANAILTESSLSFLGMGVQAPQSSWGSMLQDAQSYFTDAWWMGVFPGLLISLTVLSLNFIGDGLRDALDPRLKS